MEYKLTLPLDETMVSQLRVGDMVYLTGVLYTGRDAAHKRLVGMIQNHQPLPFDLSNQAIYYVGPTPTPKGHVIGSCGPTTSGRMDAYTPTLLAHGLKAMIGKGYRQEEVKECMVKHQAIYLGAIGGCGALISQAIKKAEVIAFDDLGAEAIRRLEVEDFPCYVLIDTLGQDLYVQGREDYLAHVED